MDYTDIRYEVETPKAIRFLKASFNADTAAVYGVQHLAFVGLDAFGETPEPKEGRTAFADKRKPDFSKYR